MPANFDDKLTIDEHGCLSPAGPLNLAEGEAVLRLDVWVFQDGGACVAVQRDFPDRSRWTTKPDPAEDHKGAMFRPGDATGMGLMVSITAGQTKAFQWTEAITLVGGKGGPDH
jgi:hypothetical protein